MKTCGLRTAQCNEPVIEFQLGVKKNKKKKKKWNHTAKS